MLLERSRRVSADGPDDRGRHDEPTHQHDGDAHGVSTHVPGATAIDHEHFHLTSHATGKRHFLHDVLDLLGLLLVGVLAWVLWPASLGGSTHIIVVQGHSMEPVFDLGDLIIVKDNPSPQIGDIIVYRVPEGEPGAGSMIVHRIVKVRDDGTFQTKGDNREYADQFHVRQRDILGTPAWTLPHVGRAIGWASNPFVIGGAIGLLSLLILLPGDEHKKGGDDDDSDDAEEMDEAQRRRWRNGRRLARVDAADAEDDSVVTVPVGAASPADLEIGPSTNISPAVAARVRSLREPQTLELPVTDPDGELDRLMESLGPDA